MHFQALFGISAVFISYQLSGVDGFYCSNVLEVQQSGLLNYLASVSFKAPVALHEEQWSLELETDAEFTFLGSWGVWVNNKPEDGKSTFRSRDENITLVEGETVSFRFRIQWFPDEPRPEVISLIWQGHQLCAPGGLSVEAIKANRRRRTSADGTGRLSGGGGRRLRVN